MKTKLLTLLIFTFFSIGGISVNAANVKKEIKLHSRDRISTRSAISPLISANISGTLLTVSCLEPATLKSATAITIIITNTETGEIVYSDICTPSSDIAIDLDEYDEGEYSLEVAIGHSCFVGLFYKTN